MPTRITNANLPNTLLALMEGPTPPDSFVSNGCTRAPDRIGGADLRAACHFHDYHYGLGGDETDRQRADDMLFRNLIRCGLSPAKANLYYRRVRVLGTWFFSYCPLARPTPMQHWWIAFRCAFTRYMEF